MSLTMPTTVTRPGPARPPSVSLLPSASPSGQCRRAAVSLKTMTPGESVMSVGSMPAPLHDAHAHRVEIARCHYLPVGPPRQRARRGFAAFDLEVQVTAPVGQRQPGDRAGSGDARLRAQAVQQGDEEPRRALGVGVRGRRQRDRRREQAIRPETGVHRQQVPEAARRQPRAEQEDDGQRHLGSHQRTADAAVCRGSGRTLFRVDGRRSGSRAAQRRQRPDHHGDERDGGSQEQQHRPVERDRVETRQALRPQRHQEHRGRVRAHNADGAAGHGDEGAFRHRYREQPPPAGPERGAQGELVLAALTPRQEQVGDVRAGDEQHESDRAEQRRAAADARRRPRPPRAA